MYKRAEAASSDRRLSQDGAKTCKSIGGMESSRESVSFLDDSSRY